MCLMACRQSSTVCAGYSIAVLKGLAEPSSEELDAILSTCADPAYRRHGHVESEIQSQPDCQELVVHKHLLTKTVHDQRRHRPTCAKVRIARRFGVVAGDGPRCRTVLTRDGSNPQLGTFWKVSVRGLMESTLFKECISASVTVRVFLPAVPHLP
ncbi:hypothetical protein BU25DRAFT_38668 [Macroventuria anomochaeta]|uniref:Uncharacterized protein n=1 Tax=Macroventuria anomochaeta TaxID=301207 RepID=A0ACB6S1M0_9PLEO|nr:uncharacterized protein BU25DRAFT_38668 [Macroventuria anomochaeta]KAF2628036.1 hypothetical protein BU25DRAFT_38668 [Macroventuria anomochaeta]